MAANYRETRVIGLSISDCVNVLVSPQFQSELDLTYDSDGSNPTGVFYKFRRGVNLSSWGETVTIEVSPLTDNTVNVDVLSECSPYTQEMDSDNNRQNVDAVFGCFEMLTVDSTEQQAHGPKMDYDNYNVCHMCGAILSSDVAFCTQCGTKVVVFEDIVCPNCGRVSPAGMNYCNQCGTKL